MSNAVRMLDAQWREEKYKEGIYRGGNEAFASMVVYGECTIMGRTVRVSFGWPDETFAADVRSVALKVLELAHAEGRQVEPPPRPEPPGPGGEQRRPGQAGDGRQQEGGWPA